MMKTKEFIKRVDDLGYLINCDSVYWYIRNIENSIVAVVDKNAVLKFSIDFVDWDNIADEQKNKLFNLIVEFTKTPIGDREEKEYYLKHRWIKGHAIMYLYRNELNGYCYLGENKCRPHKQRRFTLKDIEEIKEKFNTDLADFELVEVEE